MSVAKAYNEIAKSYDEQLSSDLWIRHILWRRYLERFPRGSHVLDIGCGTGIDALFLARNGIHVTAIDISSSMLKILLEKANHDGLSNFIEGYILDIDELGSWTHKLKFDGIISSFGSLNTINDLDSFSANALRFMKPEGFMILHMVNPSSLWEWIYLVRSGQWRRAVQLSQETERRFSINGREIRHHLMRALSTYSRYFERDFRLVQRFGLGILRPPPGKSWMPQSIETALGRLEAMVGKQRPFLNWGRFFVLEMRLRGAS